jgi:hypothetical protein
MAKSASYAKTTADGIEVYYESSRVCDDSVGSDVDSELEIALAGLGITPAQADEVAVPRSWCDAGNGFTFQLLAWRKGVDASNWRARIA